MVMILWVGLGCISPREGRVYLPGESPVSLRNFTLKIKGGEIKFPTAEEYGALSETHMA